MAHVPRTTAAAQGDGIFPTMKGEIVQTARGVDAQQGRLLVLLAVEAFRFIDVSVITRRASDVEVDDVARRGRENVVVRKVAPTSADFLAQ